MPAVTMRSSRRAPEVEPLTHLDALQHTMRRFSRRTARVFTQAALKVAADAVPPGETRRGRMVRIIGATVGSIARRQGLGREEQLVASKLLCSACKHSSYLVADRRAAGVSPYTPADWSDVGQD